MASAEHFTQNGITYLVVGDEAFGPGEVIPIDAGVLAGYMKAVEDYINRAPIRMEIVAQPMRKSTSRATAPGG